MRPTEMSPEEVFDAFSEQMYRWNLMCIALEDDDDLSDEEKDEKIENELNEIFDEYVTVRKRTHGRQKAYSYECPPEYNPETNKVASSTTDGNKAYIEVQETDGFNRKLRYTLHHKEDGWRIDKRESYDDVINRKWEIIEL